MQAAESGLVLTVADLETQEQELVQRRDAYVSEANANIAAFNGAIQQVQAQKLFIARRGEEAAAADKHKKPRHAKVAPKETATPAAG
jgi:hypothetical protein